MRSALFVATVAAAALSACPGPGSSPPIGYAGDPCDDDDDCRSDFCAWQPDGSDGVCAPSYEPGWPKGDCLEGNTCNHYRLVCVNGTVVGYDDRMMCFSPISWDAAGQEGQICLIHSETEDGKDDACDGALVCYDDCVCRYPPDYDAGHPDVYRPIPDAHYPEDAAVPDPLDAGEVDDTDGA